MRKPARLFALFLSTFLLCHPALRADRMTSLGQRPDWSTLDPYQRTLTRAEFQRRLDTLYAPGDAWRETITLTDEAALIHTRDGAPTYRLIFAASAEDAAPTPRRWRTPGELLPDAPPGKPLTGWEIALDPGHLGGEYGPMEGRSWSIDGGPVIQEGDLVLEVAQVLKGKLEALGARVTLVRDRPGPVTTETPDSLRPQAEAWLAALNPDGPPPSPEEIRRRSTLLFYRVSDIHARAARVNDQIRPDLVLCLHLNAEDFPDRQAPAPVEPNHLHLLVNGAYSAQELSYDDVRYGMLVKLLNGSGAVEGEVAASVAASLAGATGMPSFTYRGKNAVAIPDQPYVWGRNLLANRLYACPVVFLEPYVANSQAVYPRLKAEAEAPEPLPDGLIEEYAEAVAQGLVRLRDAKAEPTEKF
ncbi:N-acetylmuramoyl-L-alanine amidase [Ruficoccus amylovorans]|uniref:N-acetylmuramoyl-L-alanine amidase n=1 Tax=Ruficoccus amylovorans TaxID=1804625 RepID=A0A842HDK1_9BACT|nr:N-acetylmuramoyl-L-alanine amidase [Ruficoccus amylovorans]MBC2594289.1 N-acetylmuramoyl-L-alanine amidase [Ruficoccus amylovorans]